jgi:hypothetical protein
MSGGKISGDDLIISDYYAKSSKMIKPADLTYLVISRQALLSAPSAGGFTIKPIVVRIDLVNYKKDAAIATFGKVVIQDKENFRGKMASINNNSDYYDTFIGPVGKRQIELKTEPVNITAIPLPKEGQPDGFSGAVGDFSLDYSASSTEAKLGGYVTLKMVIKGDGNYSTVTCPRLEKASGIKPAEPRLTKGEKTATYEQVLRIQTQEVSELPRVTFNFFSPIEKKYKTITKGPLPIQISGAVAGADIMEEEAKRLEAKKEWVEGLKNITLPMKTRSTPFYRSRSFLIFEAAPIFIVVLGIFLALVMRYLKDHPLYAASFKASRRAETGISRAESLLAKGAPAEFYEQVFRTLQEYLGTRRLKPTEGVTGNILNEIDVAGIDKEVIGKINSIFHECYLVRYAETAPGKDEMHKVMESVKFVVDKLNEKTEL